MTHEDIKVIEKEGHIGHDTLSSPKTNFDIPVLVFLIEFPMSKA